MPGRQTPDWITVSDAVKLSGYRTQYVRRLLRQGRIKAQKFGPIWMVDRVSLLAYVRKSRKSKDKRRGPKRALD